MKTFPSDSSLILQNMKSIQCMIKNGMELKMEIAETFNRKFF